MKMSLIPHYLLSSPSFLKTCKLQDDMIKIIESGKKLAVMKGDIFLPVEAGTLKAQKLSIPEKVCSNDKTKKSRYFDIFSIISDSNNHRFHHNDSLKKYTMVFPLFPLPLFLFFEFGKIR